MQRLSEQNTGLVIEVIRTEFSTVPTSEFEDLISEGFLALVKAERAYNEDKGEFSTFAYHCVRNQIRSFLRRGRSVKPRLRLDQNDAAKLIGTRNDPATGVDHRDELDVLIPDPAEREFLMTSASIHELAAKHGCAPSTVWRRRKAILSRARSRNA